MKYEVRFTTRFKKDYKAIQKRNLDISLLHTVIFLLAEGEVLPEQYKDHALTGNYQGARECHIKPDWLMIYNIYEEVLVLELMRTGTHSDLF